MFSQPVTSLIYRLTTQKSIQN